ncbi:MAG: D-alanyl-D-alanine carboxypeptidase [Firmicutes bacterium]|nr:D-alanyl-D-alanine carboxypeptidase [Bacillota bacterium]
MLKSSIPGRVLAVAAALWLGLTPAVAGAVPRTACPEPAWRAEGAPQLWAWAAILMDWRTGEVLYAKNACNRRDPASTTKILTAMIALERGTLSDQVKISRRAATTPGSSMYLGQGQLYSLHDLLHGLLLRSGNDAATAIAEHIAGSVEAFADLMNAKAREIGATHSHFVNPHGLTDKEHFSTAYDLAVIARYALQNETVRQIVGLREAPITLENLNRDVVLHNTNRLLWQMEGVDGVKTGTTSAAGACLIASATRDEQKLISVVLHDGHRWSDSAHLLEWGFGRYQLAMLGREGEVLLSRSVAGGKPELLPVAFGDDLAVVTPRAGAVMPKLEVELQQRIVAPVRKGQTVGQVTVRQHGQVKAQAPLVAAQDVAKRNLLDNIMRGLKPFVRWLTQNDLL